MPWVCCVHGEKGVCARSLGSEIVVEWQTPGAAGEEAGDGARRRRHDTSDNPAVALDGVLLAVMLDAHRDLGVYILALANAAYDPALWKRLAPVLDTRRRGKADLPLNDALPSITVEPDSFTVRIDGEVVEEHPATVLPLAQRYFLF